MAQPMSGYNAEQLEAHILCRKHLSRLSDPEANHLFEKIIPYLEFRRRVEDFLDTHFAGLCTEKCFTSRLSACCSREGIITFFADVAVNVLVSPEEDLAHLIKALKKDPGGPKCVYLSGEGCLWRVRPIVCAMFLCDAAKNKVFGDSPDIGREWTTLEDERKQFTWPDKPVLFDELEEIFISAGHQSPLMYLHQSPGLLRVKALARRSN